MYNNKMRNFELPENLFSNLGELKSRELAVKNTYKELSKKNIPHNIESNPESEIKLTNYTNRQEYRNRINKMYEEIKGIIPVDNEIDNILFFHNYVEKGIVVKPKVSSLKQFWTEYRLISNEKTEKNKKISLPNKNKDIQDLDSFDQLFEALSKRIDEINKYIDELKDMRASITKNSKKIEQDKEKLANEKAQFNTYKQKEETKIAREKENLKINFDRLQTIIDDLDKKLISIDTQN